MKTLVNFRHVFQRYAAIMDKSIGTKKKMKRIVRKLRNRSLTA